ncbi:MAG TPA: DUF5602 domain-containing protein [Armatimonadota bacterium]|nr:DUF5602 domain-containing protein [Armatimonadota bacterium]
MPRLMKHTLWAGLLGFCAALLLRLPVDTVSAGNAARTRFGEARRVGQGRARSWVTLDARGRPLALGVEITDQALSGLPSHKEEYVLSLPAGVAVPPFNHTALDWNPHGHIPPQIYDVPHFDFHFYFMSPAERARITAKGDDVARVRRAPPADAIPAGYMYAPGGDEPAMGAHWVNPQSPEFHGKPFTHTLIYGFYDGRMVFVEPMVALSFLQTRPCVTAAIPQPKSYPARGYYPTRYQIRHVTSANGGAIRVSLEGLVLRDGPPTASRGGR